MFYFVADAGHSCGRGGPVRLVEFRQLPLDEDQVQEGTHHASHKGRHQRDPEPVVVTPTQ